MDHMRVLICRVNELDQMTEVAAFEVAPIEVSKGTGEQTLDALESRTRSLPRAS